MSCLIIYYQKKNNNNTTEITNTLKERVLSTSQRDGEDKRVPTPHFAQTSLVFFFPAFQTYQPNSVTKSWAQLRKCFGSTCLWCTRTCFQPPPLSSNNPHPLLPTSPPTPSQKQINGQTVALNNVDLEHVWAIYSEHFFFYLTLSSQVHDR